MLVRRHDAVKTTVYRVLAVFSGHHQDLALLHHLAAHRPLTEGTGAGRDTDRCVEHEKAFPDSAHTGDQSWRHGEHVLDDPLDLWRPALITLDTPLRVVVYQLSR